MASQHLSRSPPHLLPQVGHTFAHRSSANWTKQQPLSPHPYTSQANTYQEHVLCTCVLSALECSAFITAHCCSKANHICLMHSLLLTQPQISPKATCYMTS
jgi:hypothetical protein